jgi:hypothetical protein
MKMDEYVHRSLNVVAALQARFLESFLGYSDSKAEDQAMILN